MSRVLQFRSLKRLLPLHTYYFLAHYFWTCVITILAPTLKMTKTHFLGSTSNLRLEIGKTTSWGLGAVDNWYFYLSCLVFWHIQNQRNWWKHFQNPYLKLFDPIHLTIIQFYRIESWIELILKHYDIHILDDKYKACRQCFVHWTSHSSNVILESWKDNLL